MKRAILAVVVLVAFATTLSAAPACVSDTLAYYIANYQAGCGIGDKIFSNWAYAGSATGGALPVPASGIAVTPITTPYNPGFLFTAGWLALAGQSVDSHIILKVTVPLTAPPLMDLHLEITGYGYKGGGAVAVSETTNPFLPGTPLFVYADAGGIVPVDSTAFTPATGSWVVTKDILVSGGPAGQGGRGMLSGVINQFSEVPEPLTLSLIGSGLIALGLLRRRLQK